MFLLIALVVVGGMAWASRASLQLTEEQVAKGHQRKVDNAVWALAGYMAGIINSETARQWFDDYGVWAIFVAGFSPIPYKVFTIAAGVAALTVPGFFIASLVGRGARFFLVAALVKYAGVRFESTLEKHIERIGWAVVVLSVIVIGWFMLRGK